ncbi:MAG: hypothetical protein ACI4XJ_08920 [Eubacteriales bacterium]
MKMKELVDALPSINKIANQELSSPVLYSVNKLLSKFDAELKFYDKRRMELIDKYCEQSDGKVIPKKETAEEFEKAMRELLDVEVDVGGIKRVEIPEDENIRLSYADLCVLDGFITIKWNEREVEKE